MLTQGMIQHMRKVAAQEGRRRAFEELTQESEPYSSVADQLLAEKRASADPELYGMAVQLAGPGQQADDLYEQMGGRFLKEATHIGDVPGKAKGLARIGQVLSGSRGKTLRKLESGHRGAAGYHLEKALRHDPKDVTSEVLKKVHKGGPLDGATKKVVDRAEQVHENIRHGTRAERVGRLAKSEEQKTRLGRIAVGGAAAGGVGGGIAASASNGSDDKKAR